MLYAAKTLDDKYCGVLYDRVAGAHHTGLQSLLGRACGYGKSKRTVVYTDMETVDTYNDYWSSLAASVGGRVVIPQADPDNFNRMMPQLGD